MQIPLLLQNYQRFIVGTDLKEDLKKVVEFLNSLSIEERRKYKNVPPIISESITFKLWKEYFNYPEKSNWNRDITSEKLNEMKDKMNEFMSALDGEEIQLKPGEDEEFVIKKSYLSKTDPCFCGSGKIVIECCIPEAEFDRIVFEEKLKEQKKQQAKKDEKN